MLKQEMVLTENTVKLIHRARASANVVAAFNKAFNVYWEKLTLLDEDEFWTILDHYRTLVLMYRFQYKRTNGLDQAAKELIRKAWCGETDFDLATAVRFTKTYQHIAKERSKCLPAEYGGNDKYNDAVDNLPLGGRHIGQPRGVLGYEKGKYSSIELYEAAITMGVSEMEEEPHVLEKLVKFISHGENYNCMSLRNAARIYLCTALGEVECEVEDPQYLRMEIDRETLATLLDKTSGPLTVQVKLDDEGVVLDVLDSEGEVIDTAWQMYADCGVEVIPVSTQ